MTTRVFLYLGISLFTMLGFLFAKKLYTILAVVSIYAIALVTFSGVIPASVALSKLANHNILPIASMVVISAGFNCIRVTDKLSSLVPKASEDSFDMQMLGYYMLAFLSTNLIPNPIVTFNVAVPVIAAFCKRNGISPFKVIQLAALVCICSTGTAPSSNGIYTHAIVNSVAENYDCTDYIVKILDPMKGQLIIFAVLVVYAASIVLKLASNQPSVPVTLGGFTNKAGVVGDAPPLGPVCKVLGYGVFLLTVVGPISADALGLQSWRIAVTGAALITAVGVLKTQETIDTIPVPTMLMLATACATGDVMEACGLGDMIDSLLTSIPGDARNGYIVGFAFFVAPFLLTQFIQNFNVGNLFQSIIIMAPKMPGCNPVDLLPILGSTCNSVFMTPMSTGTIPPTMEADGYSQRDLSKMDWLPSILMYVLSVFAIMTVFPAFP